MGCCRCPPIVADQGRLRVDVHREPPPEGERHRMCKECPYWYGAEVDEYGPCSIKTARDEGRYLTFGTWDCDEGMTEPIDEGGDEG